jgi:hypothetical protein
MFCIGEIRKVYDAAMDLRLLQTFPPLIKPRLLRRTEAIFAPPGSGKYHLADGRSGMGPIGLRSPIAIAVEVAPRTRVAVRTIADLLDIVASPV